MKLLVDPKTNATVYELVPTRLFMDNPLVFDVMEHIVIMAIIPILTLVVVVVATTLTVLQLKRVVVWRQRASTKVERKEVGYTLWLSEQHVLLLSA